MPQISTHSRVTNRNGPCHTSNDSWHQLWVLIAVPQPPVAAIAPAIHFTYSWRAQSALHTNTRTCCASNLIRLLRRCARIHKPPGHPSISRPTPTKFSRSQSCKRKIPHTPPLSLYFSRTAALTSLLSRCYSRTAALTLLPSRHCSRTAAFSHHMCCMHHCLRLE